MAVGDPDPARLSAIEASIAEMNETLSLLLRAVQGEIDAGNVGLVRRVAAVERRIDTELAAAQQVHRQIEDNAALARKSLEDQLTGLKVRMAGYGFLGSVGGGGLLVAILQAAGQGV